MRAVAAFVALAAAYLGWMVLNGRPLWCACAGLTPWSTDIWSAHNSQHVIDPYSASHLLHGLVFYTVLWALIGRDGAPLGCKSLTWRFWAAVLIEVAWEQFENSPFVIERYRTATIAIGYAGDSAINSLSDVVCCATGFLIASRAPVRFSVALFVVMEVMMAYIYRDNLTLNVLMLVYPIDAIRHWQSPVGA